MSLSVTAHRTADDWLELFRGYQPAAILAAAVDLDLFSVLRQGPASAGEVARQLGCPVRGIAILLDALTALNLLAKEADLYQLPPGADELLTATGSRSLLAMAQHQANCLRRWAQLARVIKTGRPAVREPSVRGEQGDEEAFIRAMHVISAPHADEVMQTVQPLRCRRLLDVGAASGTWTLAFLRANLSGSAVLFDLPQVIPMARRRLVEAGLEARATFVAGDFMAEALPGGSDLAWVSAIVHQNSREQNQALFKNVYQALLPGGWIAIRDLVMDPSRTQPAAGALFAVNMLVSTEGGGTYTLNELREDLGSAGFADVEWVRRDGGMNSVVVGRK